MDIKKFLNSDTVEKNYNKMIQQETETIKEHKNGNIVDPYQGLYLVNQLDFFNIENVEHSEILDTLNSVLLDQAGLQYIAIFGPYVKRHFLSSCNHPIKNSVVLLQFGNKNLDEIIHTDKFEQTKNEYVAKINNVEIVVDKKRYTSPAHAILSRPNSDRTALINNSIYVAGTFLLELYKNITTTDDTLIDPVFKCPLDMFGIFDHATKAQTTLETAINKVDVDKIHKIDVSQLPSLFVQCDDNKYTPIEYALLRVTKVTNSVILTKVLRIFSHMAKIKYVRPPFLIAQIFEIDKKFPKLYEIILQKDLIHENDKDIYSVIDHKTQQSIAANTANITYAVDMFILRSLIINDNDDLFVEYASKTGYIKRLGSESNTTSNIMEWLITYNATKIIKTLIKCSVFDDFHKLKLIFVTKNIDLLDEKIIAVYKSRKDSDKNIDSDFRVLLDHVDAIIDHGATASLLFLIKLFPSIVSGEFKSPAVEKSGGNILHTVTSDNNVHIVDLLLKLNPKSINERDKHGQTPLIIYAERGLSKCVQKLLEFGAQLDLADNNGNTMLHKLCHFGHHALIKQHIKLMGDIIDVQNSCLETPAIIACKQSNEDIYYLLKGHGANVDLVDQYGNSAYHYMCLNQICIGSIVMDKKNYFGFAPSDYCELHSSFYYYIQ